MARPLPWTQRITLGSQPKQARPGGSWSGTETKIEWDIATIAPCDVFQDNFFNPIPVTADAYSARAQRIQNFIRDVLDADVIAFQEVSGEQSIKDVLPNNADEYFICSFTTHKIQRMAFAWRKTLGTAQECAIENALSLWDPLESTCRHASLSIL